MSARVRDIERLRGAAVAMVLVHHLARFVPLPGAPFLAAGGWSGVDLFFVLSGCVVGRSLLQSLPAGGTLRGRLREGAPKLWDFIRRRAFRLWPLAWLTALLATLLAAALGGEFGTPAEVLREGLAVLTCSYNFFALGHDGERLAWFWSLGVEEQFYALLPLLLLAVGSRRGRTALAALGVALPMAWRPWEVPAAAQAFEQWRYPPWARADALFAGVLLACLVHARGAPRPLPRPVAAAASWAGCALVFALPALAPFPWMLGAGATVLTLLGAGLVWLSLPDRGGVLLGAGPLLEWLGARSYALYLLHPLALRLALRLDGHPLIAVMAFAALSLATAEAAHRWVERPLRARGVASPLGGARAA
ncbi:MAG: hypothetical protein RL653_3961 [Pseudomonadota bacterium]|jgi:peptidoglycan/LPS O-acetylase OafA/YrhL